MINGLTLYDRDFEGTWFQGDFPNWACEYRPQPQLKGQLSKMTSHEPNKVTRMVKIYSLPKHYVLRAGYWLESVARDYGYTTRGCVNILGKSR